MKIPKLLGYFLLILLSHGFSYSLFAQDATAPRGKSGQLYYFLYDVKLEQCDAVGDHPSGAIIIPQGTYFYITHINDDGYVITINAFKYDKTQSAEIRQQQLNKRKQFNYISFSQDSAGTPFLADQTDNRKHFALPNLQFSTYAAAKGEFISLDFGTLIEPFKFRSKPSLFTTNLSLGAIVGFQKSFPRGSNYNWGVYAGLSLSSVTLDSFSTKGTVLVSTERPALTPSINILLGYKSINVTVGIGWDIINQTSSIEKSWVYQGKPWIGLGIGLKLFSPNAVNTPASAPGKDQKNAAL